jgi:hypothetical protein
VLRNRRSHAAGNMPPKRGASNVETRGFGHVRAVALHGQGSRRVLTKRAARSFTISARWGELPRGQRKTRRPTSRSADVQAECQCRIRRQNHRFGSSKTRLRLDFEGDAADSERLFVRNLGCRCYRPIPWCVTPDEVLRAIAVDRSSPGLRRPACDDRDVVDATDARAIDGVPPRDRVVLGCRRIARRADSNMWPPVRPKWNCGDDCQVRTANRMTGD